MKSTRIYLGPANTSNIFNELQTSLRSVGLNADFIPWSSSHHNFYNKSNKEFRIFVKPPFKIFSKNIFCIINNWLLIPAYFIYALFSYDIFFFIKPVTFLKSNNDLPILKLFKKRIFFFFVGCNDRNPYFSNAKDYVCNICQDKTKQLNNYCHDITTKKLQAEFFSKYAERVFGFADNIDFVKIKGHRLFIGMNAIKISFDQKDYSGRLKILHLPSNPLMKNTLMIEYVLNRIEEEEEVDVIIKKETWSESEIKNALRDGHILIDSLAAYTFGKISLEAIQYACVPLNAYPEWIASYYHVPPVVKINDDTLYFVLKELIKNRTLLREHAERSQVAFNKYFSYKAAGEYYKYVLNLE